MASDYKIAEGHDAVGDLEPLDVLFAGFFEHYTAEILTEWHSYETTLLGGTGKTKQIGRPWCKWMLFSATPDEFSSLLSLGTEVTIQTLHKPSGQFKTYNAMMFVDESSANWNTGEYEDLEVTFRELVEIV